MTDPGNKASTADRSGFAAISFWKLATKELRETLRDRRTLATLFVMPMLVYPILSLLFQGFLASGLQKPDEEKEPGSGEFTVAAAANVSEQDQFNFIFNDGEAVNRLVPLLSRGYNRYQQSRWLQQRLANPENAESAPQPKYASLTPPHNFFAVDERTGDTVRQKIREGQGDLGIEVAPITSLPNGQLGPIRLKLLYIKEDLRSVRAARFMEQILGSIVNLSYQNSLIQQGVRNVAPPLGYTTETVALPANQKTGISFAALIPLILTLMTITGAVYPAIDLTAGERERGTLESMIAAPVPRMRILLGKLVAIVAVAMLTAILNLIGMSITLWVFQFDRALFGEQGLTWITVGRILGLLMLFAVFFSSVLLVITSFARSFKEGQAYLIPLMMVALAPSLMSLKPDLELTGVWSVTPLVNIVLLARDVLNNVATWQNAVVTIGTTILYSAMALTMAARFFGTAKVLYGMDQGIGTLLKRPAKSRPVASASLAMLCLALLFPSSFLWQGVMTRAMQSATQKTTDNASSETRRSFEGNVETPQNQTAEPGPETSVESLTDVIVFQLKMAALGLGIIFVVIPLAMALFHRIQLASGFGLKSVSVVALLAAVLMGIGFGPLLLQAIALSADLMQKLGLSDQSISEALVQRGEAQVSALRSAPVWLVMFSMAIAPAVCEELFFRGLLFRSIRENLSPWKTILATAFLFGAFHLISTSGLTLNRLAPTTAMGVVLGWVACRSNSVIPGIILHALYNGMMVGFAYFRDDLVARNWITEQQSSVPVGVVAGGVICAVLGILLLRLGSPGPVGK